MRKTSSTVLLDTGYWIVDSLLDTGCDCSVSMFLLLATVVDSVQ